jgi:hypothetical protein
MAHQDYNTMRGEMIFGDVPDFAEIQMLQISNIANISKLY